MKKKLWGLLLTVICVLTFTMTAFAAENVSITACVIQGTNVVVIGGGSVAQSDDGNYYLFALAPYETGVGARVDYCAATPAAAAVSFTTTLDYNTASSKLYSRFVICAKRGATYVPVSNEMYITNPEALATRAGGQPAKSKKGVIASENFTYISDLADLNAGYATYVLNVNSFFLAGGVNYTYNGKTYSFNAAQVSAYDQLVPMLGSSGANVVMVIQNQYNAATADMVPALGRVAGMNTYSFNVQEQIPTEKLEALMSFLAERYTNNGHGTIHSWIIGNEVNNNSPAHYMGNVDVDTFSADYAKQFRVCYNAIKSKNLDACVYTNIDQRWNFIDTARPLQYPSRTFLDAFAANISSTGNIDWGLSFHPAAVPYDNTQFWNIPQPYAGLNLVTSSENTKFVTIQNMEVLVNHMTQAALLNPSGQVRSLLVSELGFPATNVNYATNEQYQAAALVYAYKKVDSLPAIKGMIFHRQYDDAAEVAGGQAYGLRALNGATRYAYTVFKYMDTGNTAYTDFALPLIGVSSWAQLGLN